MTMGRSHAGEGSGFGRSSAISRKICRNICRGMGDLGHLEGEDYCTSDRCDDLESNIQVTDSRSSIAGQGAGQGGLKKKIDDLAFQIRCGYLPFHVFILGPLYLAMYQKKANR